MIVKIKDRYYDSNTEPILLCLDDVDKDMISNMGEQKIYCRFPEDTTQENVEKFMEVK